MEVLGSKSELKSWLSERSRPRRVLVPTMGALHRGHTSLIDQAKEEAGKDGEVIVTIFVNPVQFGPNEDFEAYPRPLEADLEKCRAHGATAVFTPRAAEMYDTDRSILITEDRLSTSLCGSSRPGHFDGVCTVVAKLFLLTQPEMAIFGEKDFQQFAVIRRLVRDLDFPVRILAGATVREEDGLALSSRNVYLTPEERAQAPVLQKCLRLVANGIAKGEIQTGAEAGKRFREEFEAASLARIDYFDVVDSETLTPLSGLSEENPRLIAAAFFGKTRLIDNIGITRA
jgi:pantoate--beta-alanine ligase